MATSFALDDSRLPDAHRRWLVNNAILGTAAVNVVANAGPAWISTWGHARVPMWSTRLLGGPSTITDTVGTLFVLPFMTCLFCSAAVRRSQRRGSLPALDARALPPLLRRLPQRTLRRGSVLGALSVLVLAPLAIVLLATLNPGGLSRIDFTAYKAVLGVVLGLIVTPVVAVAAMADIAAPVNEAVALAN